VDPTTLILLILLAGGIVAGAFSGRFPMSGKAALGLALIPVAGVGLAMAFC